MPVFKTGMFFEAIKKVGFSTAPKAPSDEGAGFLRSKKTGGENQKVWK